MNEKNNAMQSFLLWLKQGPHYDQHKGWNEDWLVDHALLGFVASMETGVAPEALKAARQRNLLLMHEARELQDQSGMDSLILKGLALLVDPYYDVGARQLSDMDFLVKPRDIPQWDRFLKRRGYRLVPSRRWAANRFKWDYSKHGPQGELVVELHTKLFYGEKPINWWDHQQSGARKLCVEANLAHLMGHLGYQHTFLKLNWLLDIHLLMASAEGALDQDRFFAIVKLLPIKRSLQACTYILARYFQHTNYVYGEGVLPWSLILSEDFLREPQKRLSRYYLAKHLLKDSSFAAVNYNLRWLWSRFKTLPA